MPLPALGPSRAVPAPQEGGPGWLWGREARSRRQPSGERGEGMQECVPWGRGWGCRKGGVSLLLLEARKPGRRRTRDLPRAQGSGEGGTIRPVVGSGPQHPVGSGWWRWQPGLASPGARGERGEGTRPGVRLDVAGSASGRLVSGTGAVPRGTPTRARAGVGTGLVSPSQETPRGRPPQGHHRSPGPCPGPDSRVGCTAPCPL